MQAVNQPLAKASRTETRSIGDGMAAAQLELWPGAEVGGGSAASGPGRIRGGGYPDTCTGLQVSKRGRARSARTGERDPRLSDLRAARVGPVWVRVAERIGFEAFMQVWQTLSSFPGVADDRNRVYIPCIEKFLAAQRNLLMRELIAQGMTSSQIRQELVRRLGDAPALNTITKAMARVRSK